MNLNLNRHTSCGMLLDVLPFVLGFLLLAMPQGLKPFFGAPMVDLLSSWAFVGRVAPVGSVFAVPSGFPAGVAVFIAYAKVVALISILWQAMESASPWFRTRVLPRIRKRLARSRPL